MLDTASKQRNTNKNETLVTYKLEKITILLPSVQLQKKIITSHSLWVQRINWYFSRGHW